MVANLDFFVMGAQKSGTSTLHEWLSQSPEVALPWSKETHFFRDEEKYSKGIEWYHKQFKSKRGDVKVFGEIDPEYMYFPECLERIKCFYDAPKLIMILREPVLRALSHYRMSQRRGYEPLAFYEALSEEPGRLSRGGRFSKIHHSYVDRGLYAKQIERVVSQFPDSELLILKFEDLYSSRESAYKSMNLICSFIGINCADISVDVSVKHNKATTPRSSTLRDFIYGKGKLKKYFGKLIPSREMKIRIIKFIDRLNMKADGVEQNKDSSQCPDFVYRAFIDDLEKLEATVDVDVSHWIKDYKKILRDR